VITFVYLGSKGGGLHLLQGLSRLCEECNIEYKVLISSNMKQKSKFANEVVISNVPNSKKKLINFIFFDLRRFELQLKNLSKSDVYVFVMPHPLDFLIRKKLNKASSRIISIIHDPIPHPYEFFPNRINIKETIKNSEMIITLSPWSQNILKRKYGCESVFLPLVNPNISDFRKLTKKIDICFVGRNSRYKGWKNIHKVLENLNYPFSCFVQGANTKEISKLKTLIPNGNFSGSPQWLEDETLFKVIAESRVIALPYSSATQSGLIPLSNKLGTQVVAFDVGGLSSQINTKNGSQIIECGNFEKFSETLRCMLTKELYFVPEKDDEVAWKIALEGFEA
jgi:glycosyltransferase involved in cell wall biosynthesis